MAEEGFLGGFLVGEALLEQVRNTGEKFFGEQLGGVLVSVRDGNFKDEEGEFKFYVGDIGEDGDYIFEFFGNEVRSQGVGGKAVDVFVIVELSEEGGDLLVEIKIRHY